MRRLLLLTFGVLVPTVAIAHGGGVDRNGCHMDRSAGTRHCHTPRADPPPRTVAPAVRTVRPIQPLLTNPELVADSGVEIVQRMLNRLGYDTGSPDGLMGEATRAAIRSFQRDQQLVETGEVSDALVERLIEALTER